MLLLPDRCLPGCGFLDHARVIHHNVELAEGVKSRLQRCLPCGELGDITGYCDNVAGWIGLGHLLCELLVDVHYDDFSAFGCVFLSDCWMGQFWKGACIREEVPAPNPTAPPVTIATFPASLPLENVVTGVVSDVVGAAPELVYDAMVILKEFNQGEGNRIDLRS
jgi:hypothetical protein